MAEEKQQGKPGAHEALPVSGGSNDEGQGNPEKKSSSLLQKLKIIIPTVVVLAGILFGVWKWYVAMREYVSTDDAYVDGNRVAVSAKILGRVQKLMVAEGDTVSKDEELVKLDDSDLRAHEAQSQAALDLAQENVTLAKVNLDKAQTDFDRTQSQFKQNVVPKEDFDHAQSELASARARYGIAVAQVTTARAQLAVVQTDMQNTDIKSPMDGIISKRWVLPGDVVQPGEPIFSLNDLKDIWVTANLEETDLGGIHLHDSVQISVDSYPNLVFTGQVFQIGSNTASEFSLIPPNNASGNFTKVTQRVPVKISIHEVESASEDPVPLLPGMSVEVKVKVH
jgi:membrane fusion protein, multidrug efflux system